MSIMDYLVRALGDTIATLDEAILNDDAAPAPEPSISDSTAPVRTAVDEHPRRPRRIFRPHA